MNIAIFADFHGRILLAFKLCARWERETGEKLDLILQAGDMGIFPEPSRLDKATQRHAQQDPTELGFMQYFAAYSDEAAAVLAQTTCNLVCVRGNHEDHLWLDDLERQALGPLFSVDVYRRLYCLKTGVPYIYTTGNEQLTILGIGRAGPKSLEMKDKYIQPYEQEQLKKVGNTTIDVLLTHDVSPGTSTSKVGMVEVASTLREYQPRYHFHGHIGGECIQGVVEQSTQFCKLADLEWYDASQVVHPGSMAILRWTDSSTHALSVVRDAWYKEYTFNTWQYL
jgi:hypothetical protein